jgi:hypothetical protein
MLKGIDTRQRIEFISSVDTEEPNTVFVIRPLSALDMMAFTTVNESAPDAGLKLFLKRSLVEVRNFRTANIDEVIDSLDAVTLGELIGEINKVNNLSGGETKNS